MESPVRLLVVDDRPTHRDRLVRWLSAEGYDCACATGPAEVGAHLETRGHGVVVVEIETARGWGLEAARLFQDHSPVTLVLAIARGGFTAAAVRIAAHGAYALLSEPFGPEELIARVREGLAQRRLCLGVSRLIGRVSGRDRSRERMFGRLTRATRLRDEDTGGHVERSGAESARLAAESGWRPDLVERIRVAAPLHDIGKIGIPNGILLKPSKLNPREAFAMRAHTILGARMLAGSDDPSLRMARQIALCHHERWDGRGYPSGLTGTDIPEAARVVAIVDVFDALTHDRVYRRGLPASDVVSLMRQGRGTHFDPRLLDVFLAQAEESRAALRH